MKIIEKKYELNRKNYYVEIRDMIIKNQISYEKKRKTDVNFGLIRNTRRRFHHALNGQSESSSTLDVLVIDFETYRRWIEWQMTPEMNWSNIKIDQVKPICMLNVSKDEELKETFCWKNTQPLLEKGYQNKGAIPIFLDYQLQFIKSYQFLKLNQEELS